MQLLHTDAPAALYWLTPHMTAVAFMAPPGQAYPAVQSVATEELVAQVYPAGPVGVPVTTSATMVTAVALGRGKQQPDNLGLWQVWHNLQVVMSTSHRYSMALVAPG